MVKIIAAPKYETYKQIEAKYKGKCVCVTNCTYDDGDFIVGGRVLAYGPTIPEIMKKIRPLLDAEADDEYGQVSWESFVDFDEYSHGPIQVVVHA